MSKTLRDTPLTTREARKRLAPGLYWRSIDTDIHLGYRKGKRAGVWLVRFRRGKGYRQVRLGVSDDVIDVGNLDYRAAVRSAIQSVGDARIKAKAEAEGPPLTVTHAVEEYSNFCNERASRRVGRQVRSEVANVLERYVIGRPKRKKRASVEPAPIASIMLHELTERNLFEWREALPTRLKATCRQRIATGLKAALNRAYERNRDRLPAALPMVIKCGLKMPVEDEDQMVPIARENQILDDDQIRDLLAAAKEVDGEMDADGDLFRLLAVMAATGARFSQVARVRVADVQTGARRVMMPASRKGRGPKVGLTPVPLGSDIIRLLTPVLTGRPRDGLLLERWHYVQHPGSIKWHRSERGAWRTPSEIVRPWGIIRERVGLPDVVPYAFRHSSIVRAIRANLPLRLVAALHDTSVTMIERHYARYIADGLDGLAARAIVPLVTAPDALSSAGMCQSLPHIPGERRHDQWEHGAFDECSQRGHRGIAL